MPCGVEMFTPCAPWTAGAGGGGELEPDEGVGVARHLAASHGECTGPRLLLPGATMRVTVRPDVDFASERNHRGCCVFTAACVGAFSQRGEMGGETGWRS